MSARKKDINGWISVDANPISKVGVFFYSGRAISPDLDPDQLYPVYRPAEELADPECIDSFKLLPWTDDHPQRLLGDGVPAEEHGIEGVIGEKVFFDPVDGMLKANIKVFSQRHADVVGSGKRELSAGYHCKYELSPGEWNGKPYQFIQRQIRGNHLASVASGRMGPEVAVMDGFRFTVDSAEFKPMKKTNQIRKVMNRLLQFAQDADEEQLEEQEKGEIEQLKSLVGQAAPLMDQLASLPTIMAKTQLEEEAAEDEDPDSDLLKKTAESAQDEEGDEKDEKKKGENEDDPEDDKKKGGESGMDAKEIKRLIVETVKSCMPKPQESAQAMDAKELMVQISQRDILAKQLTPFIGAFDAAEMTLADVAKYGCEKLELKAQAGAELAMLSGFLHNRQPAQPLKAFGQDKKETSWLASQTKKGE